DPGAIEAAELDDLRIQLAREDPAAFCAYVLRDERTGASIELCDEHHLWHELCTKHGKLVLWAFSGAGKTAQISVGRVLWGLGRNPDLLVGVLSGTGKLAFDICGALARYIEGRAGPELHKVFPNLRPLKGGRWSSHELDVEKSTVSKDASVTAVGLDSKEILG